MAMASAKAIARTANVWMRAPASGLRPMASTALAPMKPIARAGPSAPKPMVMATGKFWSASIDAASAVMVASMVRRGKRGDRNEYASVRLPPQEEERERHHHGGPHARARR